MREYQKVATLKIGELWAIPTMLRLGLVENIRRMTLRVAARLDEVELADGWAARLMSANEKSPEALTAELKTFIEDHPPFTPTFVTRFLHQIRGYQANFTPLIWLEQWIAEEGPTAEEAVTRSNRRIAATQVTVANCITSLRTISRLDWKEFVESQSATRKNSPKGRNRRLYENVVRHARSLSARSREHREANEDGGGETSRVRRSSSLQQRRRSAEPRLSHIGYYLVDAGRYDLERQTGYSPGFGERIYRWTQKNPTTLYFGGITIGTIGALTVLLRAIDPQGMLAIVMLLMALIPASEIGISIVNQLMTMLMPPRTLPKFEFRDHGILEPYKTAVVVPTLFGSPKVVKEALEHIEVQYLANRDPNLRFAILSDFTDSPTETRDTDAEIIEAAVSGTRYLNVKYSPDGPDIFYLFHRSRLWNPQAGCLDGLGAQARKAWPVQQVSEGTGGRCVLDDRRRSESAQANQVRHDSRFRHGASA